MDKKSSFFTATAASILYFVIILMLKYSLDTQPVDILDALKWSIIFGIVIFIVHQLLNRRYAA